MYSLIHRIDHIDILIVLEKDTIDDKNGSFDTKHRDLLGSNFSSEKELQSSMLLNVFVKSACLKIGQYILRKLLF
jgi:hypothetical protein